MRLIAAMLIGWMLLGTPAAAEPPEARCLLPSRTWDDARPLSAAAAPSDTAPMLAPGSAAMVQLGDAAGVHFATPLGKPPSPGDKGGLLALHIATAGTYRVAIQHRAWIDLIRAGKPLASTAHAHGAPCSGIAKTVDFALAPGDYVLQLSGTADDTIGVRVTRQP